VQHSSCCFFRIMIYERLTIHALPRLEVSIRIVITHRLWVGFTIRQLVDWIGSAKLDPCPTLVWTHRRSWERALTVARCPTGRKRTCRRRTPVGGRPRSGRGHNRDCRTGDRRCRGPTGLRFRRLDYWNTVARRSEAGAVVDMDSLRGKTHRQT